MANRKKVKLQFSFLEHPHVVSPMNARTGLYVHVLASERCDNAREILGFVRPAVLKAGYNPDGRGEIGMPTIYGVLSRTYALWFFDKAVQS